MIDHSILSPSGRVSKAAEKRAKARAALELFPPGYWDPPQQTAEEQLKAQCLALHRTDESLRHLAESRLKPRAYLRRARQLEEQARQLEEKANG